MKVLTPILLLCFALAACGGGKGEKPTDDDSSDTSQVNIDTLTEDSGPDIPDGYFADSYPTLQQYFEGYKSTDTLDRFAWYADHPQDVKSEEQLMALLAEHKGWVSAYISDAIELSEDIWWDYMDGTSQELEDLGYTPVSAEGFFLGLGTMPVMSSAVKEYVPKDFQLYVSFDSAYSLSQGGEYPYSWLEPQAAMVLLGQKMMKKHPKSNWADSIRLQYYDAMVTLLDFHEVRAGEGLDHVVCCSFDTEYYPFSTETETIEMFALRHPDNSFSKLIKPVLDNPSQILNGARKLWYIYTASFDNYDDALLAVADNLKNGRDIAHIRGITNLNGQYKYYVGYRYYSNEQDALNVFKTFQKKNPKAVIMVIDMANWGEYKEVAAG